MTPRTWALVGGTLGTVAAGGYLARPLSTNNRAYVSVRKELEFEPLLTLPNPLLANFCMYSDPLSLQLSKTLKKVVNSETKVPLSCVDVEIDEPAAQELPQRYLVNKIPTIVALRGGNPIGRFSPENGDNLEEKLTKWIDTIDN